MNFDQLKSAADDAMYDLVSSVGFSRITAGVWSRRRGDELNVIHFQKQSSQDLFCVNLGVHFIFLPKNGAEGTFVTDTLELTDCEIRLRLTDHPTTKDQWWLFSEENAVLVADLMRHRGMGIFDSYRLDGELAAISATSIERGDSVLLDSITKVRGCLLLARLHERLGNRGKCIELATIGIKLAGMAVGPKKALKDILQRVQAA
jgi:hypothetical protein